MIDLQDKRTWTRELKQSIEKSYKFEEIINKYYIIGYHYTNLISVEDIFASGLVGLNNDVINKIKENINIIYPKKVQIIDKHFDNYIKQNNFDNRKNKIYFCCDNKQVNNGFEDIFKYYGGEISYNCFNNKILGKELLLNIGKPYIIKFIYKFDDLDWYVSYNLKEQMRDKLLQNKNISLDFSMEKDVEAKNILGAYEIDRINNKYYIKGYINNRKFENR